MSRFGNVIYINKNPNNLDEGFKWVEVKTEDMKKYAISQEYTHRTITKTQTITLTKYKDGIPYQETYTSTYNKTLNFSSRGRAGTKKFIVNIEGELVEIRAQKSLTINAFCAWVKTWANPKSLIITPGKRTFTLDGDKLINQTYFIYFILNQESNAVKIGRATDVKKRLQSLQTSNCNKLKLIKTIRVDGKAKAQKLENILHQKFDHLRLLGEWFEAEVELLDFIDNS